MKRYLSIIFILVCFVAFTGCYHTIDRTQDGAIGAEGEEPPVEPPCEGDDCPCEGDDCPGPELTNSRIKSVKVKFMKGNGELDYEDVLNYRYEGDQLKFITLAQTKTYENKPLVPPLIQEEYSYADDGKLEKITRRRGFSTSDMKFSGALTLSYEDDGRLKNSVDTAVFNDIPLNMFKWIFVNSDTKMDGSLKVNINPTEEDWHDHTSKSETVFNESGLPTFMKQTAPTANKYEVTYDEYGVNAIKHTTLSNSDKELFSVYRDLDGNLTHATYEMKSTCAIIEADEFNEDGKLINEMISTLNGSCMNWKANNDRKVIREVEYEYEKADMESVSPPDFLIKIAPRFSIRNVDAPHKMMGNFIYFRNMNFNAPIKSPK